GDNGGSLAGEAYVVFGGAGGFGIADGAGRQVIDLTALTSAQGFIIQGDVAGDYAGQSVSSAGDVNGDGFDDLIVGAPLGDDGGSLAGEAYVLFGSAGFLGTNVSGHQVIDLTNLSAAQGFIVQGDWADDQAGRSVSSAGDVNGDGFDDLIVGAHRSDDGGIDAGEAYVVFGGAGGFGIADGAGRQVIDLTTLTSAQGFIIQGDADGDFAGYSVSSAGDVNGDGFDDLIVGAYGGDDGGDGAGEAYVVFGGATGTESTVAVSRTGTGSADNFTGNAGGDTFTGIGASDVVRSGAGEDAISIDVLGFARIDGGRGTDTLALSDSGMSFDLTGPGSAGVSSVEIIDLTGTGNNTVILDRLAVFGLTEERSAGVAELTVRGNAGDTVSLTDAGWAQGANVTQDAITYASYTSGSASLLVQIGVSVSVPGFAEILQILGTAEVNEIAIGGYDGLAQAKPADVDYPPVLQDFARSTYLLERLALEDRSFDFSRLTEPEYRPSSVAAQLAEVPAGHGYISDMATFDWAALDAEFNDHAALTDGLVRTIEVWDL
ncbi:MAG: integrin alpha, partial [Alphaproteobacteria bacterium]|nr:integrin alpha [Alphaproteobacteria bacterium]